MKDSDTSKSAAVEKSGEVSAVNVPVAHDAPPQPSRTQRFGEPAHETPESAKHTIDDPEASSKQLKDCGHPLGALDAGVEHPNQPVEPSVYGQQLTQWLSLPESERAKQPKPQPPEQKTKGEQEVAQRPRDPKEAAEAGNQDSGGGAKGGSNGDNEEDKGESDKPPVKSARGADKGSGGKAKSDGGGLSI